MESVTQTTSADEVELEKLREQLHAGFLISSHFKEKRDKFQYIVFALHSNEGVESLISIPDSPKVKKFLDSKEFERHKRTLKEKAIFLIDLVGFSHYSADDQLDLIVRYQCELNNALNEFDVDHKISIGDGTIIILESQAISQLFQAIYNISTIFEDYNANFGQDGNPINFRIGAHIGPCFDFRDINSHWNVVGPGINDTQRIASFSRGYETVVSRRVKEKFENQDIMSPSGVRVTFGPSRSKLDKHDVEHYFYEMFFEKKSKPFSVKWQF